MSNDYYSYGTSLNPNTLARSGDVNSRFIALETAFDKLPAPTKLQQGRITYCADNGTANAKVVSLDFPPAEYLAGLELAVKITSANTGAATINVNGLGAKTIKRADGSGLSAGDLAAGQVVKLIYDGTDFRLLGASETAAATSATNAAASAAAAAASAGAASTSASNASASASTASTHASNASTSASNAAASAADAANAVSGYVAKAGSTMTGALTLHGAPTADLHASTKKYVDDAVFAAGAYSADGATITLSSGVFSLTTIANNTVLGNVSGSTAKPGALTATQLTALLNPATTSLQGAMSAADKTKLDAITGTNTGDQTNISGNAGTATALETARTIAISGSIVTGTATSFDGTANISIPITSLNVGNATAGTLAVARGGTGVTSSTGSGSNVLSASPDLTGNPTAPTQSAGNNSTRIATTAYVQGEIGTLSFAPKFMGVVSSSANLTLTDASHNNAFIEGTGSTGRTITLNSTPSAGFACVLKVTGTGNRTLSCSGGLYKNDSASTATSGTVASGGIVTLIHKGGGVWTASGSGLT